MTTELRNKLLSQSILAVSGVIFPIFTLPIVTHAIGPSGLGKVIFTDSLVQFLVVLASIGIPLYGIREVANKRGSREDQSKIFCELFSLQFIFTIPAVILLWIIGYISHIELNLLIIATISMVGSCLTFEWFFQGNEAFFWIALRTIMVRAITLLLIYLLINNATDYALYYLLLAGSILLSMVLNFFFITKRISFSFYNLELWKHLKNINWIYAGSILISVYTLLDTVLLGWLSSSQAVGYYSLGYKIVRLSSMLIISMGVVFIPRISFQYFSEDKLELKDQIQTSQHIIFFLALPLSLFFFVVAPEVVALLGGKEFMPSVRVIKILSAIPLLISFSHFTGFQLLFPMKKEKKFFMFLAVGTLLNIALNLLLIPSYKETGAAISNLSAEAFITISSSVYLIKNMHLLFSLKMFFYSLLSSSLIVPIAYLLRAMALSPLLLLIVATVTFGTGYLIIHLKLIGDPVIKKLFSSKLSL